MVVIDKMAKNTVVAVVVVAAKHKMKFRFRNQKE